MVSPTQPLLRSLRRLALTTKMVGKGYYKGNRTGSMGRHTRHGGYIIDWNKVRTYVVPDLKGFMLTPFVTKKLPYTRGRYAGEEGPMSGELFLKRWKVENGQY
ncbi:mitochondrial ribosomal protein L27-domain-containing protein [Kalaharituber pfeilii]|nr:mitochondrial ribosomal protein L27-domain-containing protein [Kalaharituber pfeilii]